MSRVIIDRIEGDTAVCELPGREMRRIPLSRLPEGAREGDCLRAVGEGYVIDREETARRRRDAADRLRRLLAED